MPIPSDPEKQKYMFMNDMKFLQKAIIFHPSESDKFLTLKRPTNAHSRPNCWDLPGGNVLFGQNNQDSLIKEIGD